MKILRKRKCMAGVTKNGFMEEVAKGGFEYL